MSAAPRRRVLVIDDEKGPRESLRILLKNDYDVVLADSVAAGIAALKATPPDVIISDIKMPVMTGIEGLRLIREVDRDTAVVMLTGYGDLTTAREAIRLGANDYLCKPFEMDDMLRLVRENIARTDENRRKNGALGELERLNHELQEQLANSRRMAVLGLTSSQMVHDISNPLTIVVGYLDLLQMALERTGTETMPAEARQYLGSIEGNLRHCTEVLQTWRSLGNKAALRLNTLRAADLVGDVVHDLKGAPASAARLSLDVTPEGAIVTIAADRTHLRRALQNVIHNALQAVDPTTGRVSVRCGRENGMARIDVVDNGCGIPPENIQRVFEPFFTTKKEGKGTGLGLFITKQVVEDHEGRVEITSRSGEGTRVSILLPAVA
ncbi:MAG: hybrid sensor histidine kinase/response regulator [Verrucomicrobia bacterium]|nr:hybrid sensor histidine kinase/response regulator [Verrucomicrobiota bacterium]